MQQKYAAGLLVGIFIVLVILGILAAVALPHASQMSYQSQVREREDELLQIKSAVMEMLGESPGGKLVSIGPTADLSLVRTADAEPLYLADYLPAEVSLPLKSGCTYSFTADGLVLRMTD